MPRLQHIVALLFACIVLLAGTLHAAELTWPAVTNETRPWTRWWWLGSICTDDGLRSEMQKYAAAGIGGLEITPIYGVRGQEDRFIQYLSPQWMDRLATVLADAKRLGLGIDMATGNGWPFGGPWVGDDDACKYMAQKTFTVKAGQRLAEPVTMMQQASLRFAGPKRVPITEIKDPVSDNPNMQDLALDQVRFPKPLPLATLMAFSDTGAVPLDLTSKVGADGALDWIAPADSGTWTLYAVFQGWHGKMVERAGPGGEGNVIDHFHAADLYRYLKKFDDAFAGRDLAGLRAFFNDSYEVDDARGESNFTPRFFDEFQRRRGYDLRTQLPALFVTQPTEQTSRVLSDYRETISDLLLDEFTNPWRKWAAGKGAVVRNQAHGSPANILDLYAASDIPETEGDNVVAMKYASSAAHVTGKRLASAECCTWLGEHFTSTLGDAKARVDLTFLGGINHICYHGTPYSPPEEKWPGFLFYAAVHFGPTNSWWDDFPALNQYVTRCQSFLQAGQPDEDVLLYVPMHDRWAQRGNGAMPHFNANQTVPVHDVGQQLLKAGYAFDFISDRLLKDVTFENGSLRSGGNTYKAIVLPETKLIPLETMEKLIALAKQDAIIVVQKALPADVPGWGNLDERRSKLKSALLGKYVVRAGDVTEIPLGKGRFVVGDGLGKLLARAGIRPETMQEFGMQFVRRRDGTSRIYFIVNRGDRSIDGWVSLSTAAPAVAVFDPGTGHVGRAAVRAGQNGGAEIFLQLAPGQSCIVKTFAQPPDGPQWIYFRAQGQPQALAGAWDISFTSGGPELPASVQTTELRSWTEFGGDAVKTFSGTAKYKLNIAKPQAAVTAWQLDLGRVAESARVTLNGDELGTLIAAPFTIDIPAGKLREQNTLEIAVSNLMANRITDMDRHSVPWKKFYNTNFPARIAANRGRDNLFSAASWTPRESGLIGPVTLMPLEAFDPTVGK